MHMLIRKDLNLAEPTMVITANGKVQTKEEATVYVNNLSLFVIVQILEDTLAVLSLGKPHDVEVQAFRYWETSCEILRKTPNTKKRKLVAGFARVVRRLHRKSRRRRKCQH